MAFQYLEAPTNEEIGNKNSVFLAGGITNVWDWQKILSHKLRQFNDLTVINPRRENFAMFKNDSSFKASEEQIKWEFKHLRLAKQVVFWFSNETVQPITLFELGSAIERNNQDLIIGCHKDYPRVFDVKIQLELRGHPAYRVLDTFDKFMEAVVVFQKNRLICKN